MSMPARTAMAVTARRMLAPGSTLFVLGACSPCAYVYGASLDDSLSRGGPTLGSVSLLERVQSDITAAMKSGERDRVGALRLVSSELQKAHKEAASGSAADEVAGPPRERKRPGRGGTPPPPARGGDPPPAPGGQGERSDAPPPPPPPPHA